jgi:hypothetical protein
MASTEVPPKKIRSFSADSPFSLIGILIAAVIGLVLGGVIAMWLV